jgi:hypothetical protein
MANIRAGGLIVRLAHTIATVIGLSLYVTACDVSGPTFNVIGSCTDFSGTLNAQGARFTPHGSYTTKLTDPNGKAVVGPAGKVSSTGTTLNWRWDCKDSTPGVYNVTITDKSTSKHARTTFVVDKS